MSSSSQIGKHPTGPELKCCLYLPPRHLPKPNRTGDESFSPTHAEPKLQKSASVSFRFSAGGVASSSIILVVNRWENKWEAKSASSSWKTWQKSEPSSLLSLLVFFFFSCSSTKARKLTQKQTLDVGFAYMRTSGDNTACRKKFFFSVVITREGFCIISGRWSQRMGSDSRCLLAVCHGVWSCGWCVVTWNYYHKIYNKVQREVEASVEMSMTRSVLTLICKPKENII